MLPEQKLGFARQLVAERMSSFYKQWHVTDDMVKGPGSTSILVRDHSEPGQAAHIDFGFYFNMGHPEPLIIWDCAGGIGDTEEEKVRMSVDVWSKCTAIVLLEWLAGKGELAEHANGDDGLGLKGWHAIHGPVWGLGHNDGPDLLQKWVLERPLLPQLSDVLPSVLQKDHPAGVKFFFGSSSDGEIAEVRVNGKECPEASAALQKLNWPRFTAPAYVRCFVFFVHPL